MPRAYVRQLFCFPTIDPYAVDTLRRGLSGLLRDVPYMLSLVTSPGVAATTPEDIFTCHDLSASVDYAALKAENFPPAAFLAPGIIPPAIEFRAVLVARASLVRGGLILCVAVHHSVTDITGFGALLKIWAAHCRDGSSERISFSASWMDRGPLFIQPQSSDPLTTGMPDLLHIRTASELARQASRSQTGQKDYQTGIFYFAQHRLKTLKETVNAHLHAGRSWVSTSDVLSTLLWSAVVQVQEPLGSDGGRISTLSFPVQFRSVMRPPLPRDFLGAAFLMTNAKVAHEDVCSVADTTSVNIPALAKAALAIRRSTQGIDDAAVRRVLAYLEAHPDPEPPPVLGPPRYEAGGGGTSVVSWADQGVYELDWGVVVGQCDAVRLPKMASERDPIVLPRVPGPDGGLEVIMSYEEAVMKRLIEGSVMKRFAVLRCLS
jgi:hypothetical protein